MRQVVNRLYTFHLLAGDPRIQDSIARWETVARKWDEPELDEVFLKVIEGRGDAADKEDNANNDHL